MVSQESKFVFAFTPTTDDGMSVAQFAATISDLRHLLAELETTIAGAAHLGAWSVSHPQIRLSASPNGTEARVLEGVVQDAYDAFRAVEDNLDLPASLNETAQELIGKIVRRLRSYEGIIVEATDREEHTIRQATIREVAVHSQTIYEE